VLLSAGAPDLTFGTMGVATAAFAGSPSTGIDVLAQPDGKVVLAAMVGFGGTMTPSFGLARFNADGSPDTTFGMGGQVVGNFFNSSRGAFSRALLQPDGKIVIVAVIDDGMSTSGLELIRYKADGTPDGNFGTGGIVVTTNFGPLFRPREADAGLLSDGKIVVITAPNHFAFKMLRYNVDGTLDSSFGTGGVEAIAFGDSLAVQPDGRILVSFSNVVGRFNPDGSPDSTFGVNGMVSTGFRPQDPAALPTSIVMEPDGKVLVACPAANFGDKLALLRFDANGNLDPTFGVNGSIFLLTSVSHALALQASGRILLSGDDSQEVAPFVDRFDPNGTQDATFDATEAIGFHALVFFPRGMAVQPDGEILVAATSGGSGNANALVTRLLTDNPLPSPSQRFVAQAYLDLLQRTVDPVGLAVWPSMIDQGQATRTQVVLDIEASPEYLNLKVQELFGMFLNRPAMPDEAIAYTRFLASGGTIEQMEVTLTGSPEYYKTNGGMTNDGFIDAVYRDALGRAEDPTGMSEFVQALNDNTLSPAQVAAVVFASDEFFGHLGQSLYHQFLHRDADPTGLNGVISALHQGITDQAIIAGIVGSDEYLAART
jgi:uncharacterized delta-60 repeat protein